jgi:hypothetical protein
MSLIFFPESTIWLTLISSLGSSKIQYKVGRNKYQNTFNIITYQIMTETITIIDSRV